MKNACAYIRVSSEEQVDNFSLDVQERECRRHATANDLEFFRIFREEGVSGKTAAGRPVLQEMLEWCKKQKGLKTVVVYKLDRLSRNQLDFHKIKEALKQSGVSIRSATEPHQEGPAGILTESMLAMLAEYDNAVRGERSRAGMAEAVKAGCWCWMAPLGYRVTRTTDGNPTLEIDPVAGPIIAEAFRQYASGAVSQAEIVEQFKQAGIRSRNGNIVTAQAVTKMLASPTYCGKIRSTLTDGELRPGNWPAIVPVEVWERCQKFRTSRAGKHHREASADFPLRGSVVCAECGRPLTGYFVPSRNGQRKYRYYACPESACKVLGNADKVEAEFKQVLDSVAFPDEMVKRIREDVLRKLADNRREVHQEQAKAQRGLDAVKERQQKLLEKLLDGTISDASYKAAAVQIETEMIRLRVAAHDLEDAEALTDQEIDEALDALRSPYAVWQRASAMMRKRLVGILFRNGLFATAGGAHISSNHQKRRQDSDLHAIPPAFLPLASLWGFEPQLQA